MEAEVHFAEGLAGREQVLLRQMLERNFVIDFEPIQGFDVISTVFPYVADDVGPPRLLPVVSLSLRVPVCGSRRLELHVHLETTEKGVVAGFLRNSFLVCVGWNLRRQRQNVEARGAISLRFE